MQSESHRSQLAMAVAGCAARRPQLISPYGNWLVLHRTVGEMSLGRGTLQTFGVDGVKNVNQYMAPVRLVIL
jgi:hypothetical protein